MIVNRVVWIIVTILFVVVAFVGGVMIGSWNTRRVAFAGNSFGPAMMRGTQNMPMMRNGRMPFGYNGRQNGMMRPGGQMMPGYGRGVAPNNRGNAPQLGPNQRRGVPPSNNPPNNQRLPRGR